MKIPLHELNTLDGLHGKQIKRKDPPPGPYTGDCHLTPRARRRTEIDNNHPLPNQPVLVIDLHKFVRCPGSIAFGLGSLNEGIIDMFRHPGFAGLGALHRGTITPFFQ